MKNRDVVVADYYLKAFELSSGGKYAEAYKSISLCGDNANSPGMAVFRFELATVVGKASDIVDAEKSLPNLPQAARRNILKRLQNFISKRVSTSEEVTQILLLIHKYDSEDENAARVALADVVARKDFLKADAICTWLEAKHSGDRQVYESRLVSLYERKKYSEGLILCEKSAAADVFSQIYAAYFSARLGNAKDSLKHAMNAVSSPKFPASTALELGAYFAGNLSSAEVVRFAEDLVSSSGDVAEAIAAMVCYRAGDTEGAKTHFSFSERKSPDAMRAKSMADLAKFVMGGRATSLKSDADDGGKAGK